MKETKIKPIIKLNNGAGAILCNKCRKIIKEYLTDDEFDGKTSLLYCDSCIEKIVNEFPTQYKEGFTSEDEKKILELFPNINMEKYYDALRGNTCIMKEGKIISYHCDIITALRCGTGNRNIRYYEWD